MKTIIFSQTLIFTIVMLSIACSKNENININNHEDDSVKLAIFDTLKGSWNWYATYDAKKGMIDNDYNVVIKFLSVNKDSSIVYETYKNDTLVKNGDLKIIYTTWGTKIVPRIVPITFYFPIDEIYIRFLSIDTLELYDHATDSRRYYFSK